MLPTIGAGGLCLVLTCAIAAGSEEGPFREMSFDQARTSAAEGGKRLVLIDFYTTWCGPCKKLDQTTWKDQGVKDWLAKEAVCLKLDAEKETALAAKYRIDAYPTVLLLRPDGAEIDRLVGYRDARTFLAEARDALAGNDTVARARKKLQGGNEDNPMLRMNHADALAQKGRREEALAEYLWCFDHGNEHSPAFAGVRGSFLLSAIARLGQSHPPALVELRKRRDAARKSLEEGKADHRTAMDLTSLNRCLGRPEDTLSVYDALRGKDSVPQPIRRLLRDQSLDLLLKAKRYKEALDGQDAAAATSQRIARFKMMMLVAPRDEELRSFMKRQMVADCAKYYEAMIGTGNTAGAAEVAKSLVAFDGGALPALIAAARRAGDDRTADELTREAGNSKEAAPK